MFLVYLNYPAQMTNFFNLMFPLITFDAFPTGWLYDSVFDFNSIQTDYSLNEHFKNVGYGSIFIVNNIGSLGLMTTVWIFILVLASLLKKCKVFDRCKKTKKL